MEKKIYFIKDFNLHRDLQQLLTHLLVLSNLPKSQ